MISPREEFIGLMTDNMRVNGLDELSSKILATLFIETEEISLEDLAKKTGYSLSSLSTSLKLMEATGIIHKFKKPHSKKMYLKMENDMIQTMLNMLKGKQQHMIKVSKELLPGIIADYKKTKSSKQELQIIEKYYKDILLSESIIEDMIMKIEKERRA